MKDTKTVTFEASQWQLVPKSPVDAQLNAIADADGFDPCTPPPTPAAQSAGREAVSACSVCYGTGFDVNGRPCTFPHAPMRSIYSNAAHMNTPPPDWFGTSYVPPEAALSADGGEEAPSLANPLTPYGMLVRALRIVADTTLMEMADFLSTEYTIMRPSYLSGMEFGRNPIDIGDVTEASKFFASKGMPNTLDVLLIARNATIAAKAKGDAK